MRLSQTGAARCAAGLGARYWVLGPGKNRLAHPPATDHQPRRAKPRPIRCPPSGWQNHHPPTTSHQSRRAEARLEVRRTVSRFLYPCGRQPFIWAGHCCPALATYPRVHRSGPLLLSYLVLLRVGFALPAGSLRPRCALTAPFHPYPDPATAAPRRCIFCCTFRKGSVARTLPGR